MYACVSTLLHNYLATCMSCNAEWPAGGQGIVPGGNAALRRASAADGDFSSLSVRRWDELVKAVQDKVGNYQHILVI